MTLVYISSMVACWWLLARGLRWASTNQASSEACAMLIALAGFSVFPLLNTVAAILALAWTITRNDNA